MRLKTGVRLDGVHFMLWYAAAVWDWMRQSNGFGEGTITGGREPADSVGAARTRGTLHPSGRALDFRTNDLPGGALGVPAQQLAAGLQNALGADFDVVLEGDHCHVEYVPLTRI